MYTDVNGNTWYKVQLHLHTTLSDGKFTPEQAAKRYKEAGFDALAITDHWVYHKEDTIEGLKIIPGCEYHIGASDTSDGVMHIVGIGMRQAPETLALGKSTRQDVIDGILKEGGLPVLAHPAWSLNTPADAKALQGIGAVEIYNSVSNVEQSRRPYSGYFVDLLANEGYIYPLLATDDTHYYKGEDDTVSYIMVRAKSCNTPDLLSAIRVCDFYATQGPHLTVHREGDKIIADCSNCVMISFLSNLAWTPDRVHKGETLTHAEYQIKDPDRWVRVEVMDKQGNFAWSNIIKI